MRDLFRAWGSVSKPVCGSATTALQVNASNAHTGSRPVQRVKKAFDRLRIEGFFNKWRITGSNR